MCAHIYTCGHTHTHTCHYSVGEWERKGRGGKNTKDRQCENTAESNKKPTRWEETSNGGTGPVLHTCHPALGAPCATPGFVPEGPVHAQTGQAGTLAWTAGS